jgi:hypothetical protein
MKNWFNENFKTIIILAFLIPIITVAIVSISHVTKWYGISNPVTWAVYLSVGIEIAALSALAAISANMGNKVYFSFGIVTLVQFIGNIFFAYSYIDVNGESFKSWVELTSPLVEFMGVDPNDFIGHKRFLAFFAGGMLPLISLSFLHMLVKFTQNSKNVTNTPIEPSVPVVDAKDIVGEVSRVRLSEDELSVLENLLSNQPKPNEEDKMTTSENFDIIVPEPFVIPEEVVEEKINEPIIEKQEEILPHNLKPMNENLPTIDLLEPEVNQTIDEPQPINEPVQEVVPALGDDEVREMVLDEWERKFDLVEDESEEVIPEPTSIPPVVEEPTPVVEPIVEEIIEETPIVEPVIEEPIEETPTVEPIVEEPIVEEVIEETPTIEPIVEEPIVMVNNEQNTVDDGINTEPVIKQQTSSEPTDEEKKN